MRAVYGDIVEGREHVAGNFRIRYGAGKEACDEGPSRYRLFPFDRQEILLYLFHPRPESGSGKAGTGYEELSIPVGGGIHIGGRLYAVDPASPYLLFFHGNGEIVEDYHDLGDIYTRLGLNFMPVDYRGYGKSTGAPTVSAMMRDCHAIYEYACELLSAPARSGPLVVMGGRSAAPRP